MPKWSISPGLLEEGAHGGLTYSCRDVAALAGCGCLAGQCATSLQSHARVPGVTSRPKCTSAEGRSPTWAYEMMTASSRRVQADAMRNGPPEGGVDAVVGA